MSEPNQEPSVTPFDETLRSHFEGNPEALTGITTAEDVERAAMEILDALPEGRELMERITTAREKNHEDVDAVRERGNLWRAITVEISLVTGVEIEAAEHEAQRDTYRKNLRGLLSSIDTEASDEDIMLKLGMIRPVEGARGHIFSFPARVFPPFVKEQWETYLGMIKQFDDAQRKLKAGIITQEDFNGIDRMRTSAHNTVSHSVGEVLEFSDWELDDYRRLVAKMRDGKFAEPKGELGTYASLLRERIPVPEHLTNVHRHLGRHGIGQVSESS